MTRKSVTRPMNVHKPLFDMKRAKRKQNVPNVFKNHVIEDKFDTVKRFGLF